MPAWNKRWETRIQDIISYNTRVSYPGQVLYCYTRIVFYLLTNHLVHATCQNFSRNKVHFCAPNAPGINLVHFTSLTQNAKLSPTLVPRTRLAPHSNYEQSHTPNTRYVSAHSQTVSNTEHKSFPIVLAFCEHLSHVPNSHTKATSTVNSMPLPYQT